MISLRGAFDAAALDALCVDNTAPTPGEVLEAKADVDRLAANVGELLLQRPVIDGKYVREQPAFRPVKAMMEKAGWRFCGSGYYSAAFFKGGLAMKIGFKPEDSALLYAAWCRMNQGRAGVPLIHKLKSHGTCFALLMDRLEPLTGELDDSTALFDPILAAEVSSVKETINLGADGLVEHMDLCRTAADIREFFRDIANFDIHEANVMLDRSGNLVITDPVSFVGDYQSFYTENTDGYRQAQ